MTTYRIESGIDKTFTELLLDAWMTNEQAAELFGVSVSTIIRWKKGIGRPHSSGVTLIRVMAYGLHHLPNADKKWWAGWKINGNCLYDPQEKPSQYHTSGTIRAWFWVAQQLHALDRKELTERKEHSISNSAKVISLPIKNGSHGKRILKEVYEQVKEALNG